MKRALFGLVMWMAVVPAWAAGDVQSLLQLIDYMSVDYPEAVQNGKVINSTEYAEMRDFARAIEEKTAALNAGPGKEALLRGASILGQLVKQRGPAGELAEVARRMRENLLGNYEVAAVPRAAPDFGRAQSLYAAQCASCHGAEGRGDGPQAAGMEPPPIAFSDRERAAQRSVFGLYNTITLGVTETAMPGFAHLSDKDRWGLAFLVGRWGLDGGAARPLNLTDKGESPVASLDAVATLSAAEVRVRYGADALQLFTSFRSDPAPLFAAKPMPLEFTRKQLAASLEAYRNGYIDTAYQAAVTGYLEGFELVEAGLNVAAPALRSQIEKSMTDYRNAVRDGAPASEITQRAEAIDALLAKADSALADRSLSGSEAFTGAAVILLREGLEAILVVAALAAFLIKTGRRDGLRYLHAGWVGALLLGFATWWVAENVITIGGAERELTEGFAAVIAAGVLFYVGFWLHSKTASSRWKQFIEGSVQKALTTSTLWSLAGLSFIAVYREVFETILFYQALWVQAGPTGEDMVLTGAAVSSVVLMVLAFLIIRSSTRLPLRQFFGITGALMFVLALVFAGKGIAAFQEAGKLPITPVELLPSIDLLGIYPNLQSVGLQVAMLAIGAYLLYRQRPAEVARSA